MLMLWAKVILFFMVVVPRSEVIIFVLVLALSEIGVSDSVLELMVIEMDKINVFQWGLNLNSSGCAFFLSG